MIEAWLQGKVDNANRGQAMGLYRVFDLGASLVAQMMIGFLEPASYVSYNLLALLCCAALLPLTLTQAKPPQTAANPRLRPLLALQRSPLAVAGVVVAGLTAAAFRMVGPIYGQAVGLAANEIGLFLAAFVAGGALAQYPAGWVADRIDCRKVLIAVSALATLACGMTILAAGTGAQGILIAAGIFGFVTFPIFSVSAAHAHDFASQDERVELSAALIFYFALGAIASPLMASLLIDRFGPPALFLLVAVGHLALVVFGLIRLRVDRPRAGQTPHVYAPRTSFLIGRLLRHFRDSGGSSEDQNRKSASDTSDSDTPTT